MRKWPLWIFAGGTAAWRLTRTRPLVRIPPPRPAADYEGALARVAGLRAADGPLINPACATRLLTHGKRMARAIAMLHGFTNCPAQFDAFAQLLFAQGWNVLLPRLAHHGLNNRASPDFGRLTAEEMARHAAEVSDILQGLGEQTTLLGFSMGGALATWAAQQRSDLGHVVIVSPAIAVQGVKPHLRRVLPNLFPLLPDRFLYWDPALEEQIVGPPHAYPGYSTRALGQLVRMGLLAEKAARAHIFAARRVTVITNSNDEVVDNAGIARVVHHWRRLGAPVETYELPREWGPIHDIMDPTQLAQQTERVYPWLIERLDAESQR